MAHLVVREPGHVAFSVPLREEFHVGRHEDNELVLRHPRVSRRHARLAPVERGWQITDFGSTHGTRVNGVRVEQQILSDADRIQLGSVVLVFSAEDEPGKILHSQNTATVSLRRGDDADQRLALLHDVTRALSSFSDPDELLGSMLDAVLDVFGCERAVAGIGQGEATGLRRVARCRGAAAAEDIVVSQQMLNALLMQQEGTIVCDARGQDAPRTLVRERILSAMGAPLVVGPRVLGFLYVDDRRRAGRFSPRDLEYLIALGRLTAAVLDGAERYRQALDAAPAGAKDGLFGESEPMRKLRAQIRKYGAAAGSNVLIRGESGSGKELVARSLHASSPRAERPLVAVNCAAIPDTLIEGELFGHVKGAFTGAVRDRKGSFEQAHRSTLFLDEIGDLSLSAQAKLLRVIQEGEVQPLGSERLVRVDVRILAATHKDLQREIEAGRFREDLYYRIAVLELEVPPLSERGDDIELLARALLGSVASGMGKRFEGFTKEALSVLRGYRWPGNVRELRNEVERAAINAESSWIDVGDLSPRLLSTTRRQAAPALPVASSLAERFAALETTEQALIKEAMAAAQGNLAEAARQLGISWIMMKRRVSASASAAGKEPAPTSARRSRA